MQFRNLFFFLLFFVLSNVTAESIPPNVINRAESLLQGIPPDKIEETLVPGLYQISYGTQIIYLFEDGRYLLNGDLIDLNKQINMSEEARNSIRKNILNKLNHSSMIIFTPKVKISTISVFTDTECRYCVQFHEEIDKLLAAGVEVRYLGFPRTGIGSSSYNTLVSVWCAENPQLAMTNAKLGIDIENKKCETDIGSHIDIAQQIGVKGTPSIILQNGKMIPGYLPSEDLIELSNMAVSR